MGMKIVPAEYFGVVERFSVFAATASMRRWAFICFV
jgi:hypothetical protein